MLYENTKAMVSSPNGEADFFDIITGDTSVPFLFITFLDYIL